MRLNVGMDANVDPARRSLLLHVAAVAAAWPAQARAHASQADQPDQADNADPANPADGGRRMLRFALTATNPTPAVLEQQVVWLYMPMQATPTQVLEQLQVSVPHQVVSDALGHTVVRLAFDRLAPLASKVVSLTAQVRLAAQPVPAPLADAPAWLAPQRFVEVDDPAVQAQAARLRRPNAMDTATAIYAWVRDHLHYAGYLADELGARQALMTRRGDCTEYASLATALARACGIPARVLGGYVAAGSIAPRPPDYHNWAELYVDAAWRTLDAQKRQWQPAAPGYVAFRIDAGRALNPVGLAHRYRVEGDLQVQL